MRALVYGQRDAGSCGGVVGGIGWSEGNREHLRTHVQHSAGWRGIGKGTGHCRTGMKLRSAQRRAVSDRRRRWPGDGGRSLIDRHRARRRALVVWIADRPHHRVAARGGGRRRAAVVREGHGQSGGCGCSRRQERRAGVCLVQVAQRHCCFSLRHLEVLVDGRCGGVIGIAGLIRSHHDGASAVHSQDLLLEPLSEPGPEIKLKTTGRPEAPPVALSVIGETP